MKNKHEKPKNNPIFYRPSGGQHSPLYPLLLAKTRKEELGKLFAYISWFFLVVGFILFIGNICVMTHGYKRGHSSFRHEMMMKGRSHGMYYRGHGMYYGMCCPPGMQKGCCDMKNDSIMKSGTKHPEGDNSKMPGPK